MSNKTVEFDFVDASGKILTGSEEVAGYSFADFFGGGFQGLVNCDTTEEADALLAKYYLGPDCDGIGVKWNLHVGAN